MGIYGIEFKNSLTTNGVDKMKIFRTTWENSTGHGCVSSWNHTVAAAKAEARQFNGVWETVETAKFEPWDNAENIRRLMNQDWQENPYLTITVEKRGAKAKAKAKAKV